MLELISFSKLFDIAEEEADASFASSDEYLFQSSSLLHPGGIKCEVKITSQHLIWTSDSLQLHLKIPSSDILGCRLAASNDEYSKDVVIITAMVRARHKTRRVAERIMRCRMKQAVSFEGAESEQMANQFRATLNRLCRTILDENGIESQRFGKPVLIMVNPKSGSGRSAVVFESEVKPLLQDAEIPFELFLTDYIGHAKQHLETCDLACYSAIVTMGGDGTLFEVLNALFSRHDWEKARKMPIGVLPGGSANALATAFAYASGESYRCDLLQSTLFALCKHEHLPLDLMLFQTKNRFIYSCLEFSWGFLADVDIESESLRALGIWRFHVFGLYRVLFKRTRRARITYLPYEENENDQPDEEMTRRHEFRYLPPLDQPITDKRWKTIEMKFFNITMQNRAFLSSESYKYPQLRRLDPGFMIALIAKEAVSRMDVLKLMLADEMLQSTQMETIKMKAFRFEPLDDTPSLVVVDGELIEYGPLQAEVMPRVGRAVGIKKTTWPEGF